MKREIHFLRMKETSNAVSSLIKEAYSDYTVISNNLSISLEIFLNKRTNNNQHLLRPYLVRLGYEIAGGENWKRILPACASVEVFNISTYQSNIAFDDKINILTRLHKNNQFISSMLSLDKSLELLLMCKNILSPNELVEMYNYFHKINSEIYIGQFFDLNEFKNYSFNFNQSIETYTDKYIERCKYLGGSLTSLCLLLGSTLAKGNKHIKETLVEIGYNLGIGGQILNDLSDYVPIDTDFKSLKGYKTCFSDFKSGKITYPLFHLLHNLPEKEMDLILNIQRFKEIDIVSMQDILNKLVKYGSIKSTKSLIWQYYNLIKKNIMQIPKSEFRDFLSLAFSSLLTNKYFSYIRENYEKI